MGAPSLRARVGAAVILELSIRSEGGSAMLAPAPRGRPETPTALSGTCGHARRSRNSSSLLRSRPSERGAS
eukprot:13574996-Alexandrium_andersonii.AAC.1